MPKQIETPNDKLCTSLDALRVAISDLQTEVCTLSSMLGDLSEFNDGVIGLSKELNFLNYNLRNRLNRELQ